MDFPHLATNTLPYIYLASVLPLGYILGILFSRLLRLFFRRFESSIIAVYKRYLRCCKNLGRTPACSANLLLHRDTLPELDTLLLQAYRQRLTLCRLYIPGGPAAGGTCRSSPRFFRMGRTCPGDPGNRVYRTQSGNPYPGQRKERVPALGPALRGTGAHDRLYSEKLS